MAALAVLTTSALSLLAPTRVLPGPTESPFIGSLDFLRELYLDGVPLPSIIRKYRSSFGDAFTIKTGPVRQVWICDEALVDEVYSMPEVSGRSQLPEGKAPFGSDFLFLVRDPDRAKPIRREQRQWLQARASERQIASSVEEVADELFAALDNAVEAGVTNGAGGALWPSDELGATILGALLNVFALEGSGNPEVLLSIQERSDLLAALSGYRKRSGAPKSPFSTKLDYAEQVRGLLLTALRRSSRSEDEVQRLLPLLVSACVGGGEIFPLLIQWAVRRLAVEPSLQAELVEPSSSVSSSYSRKTARVVSAVLRQCPYSCAIGPPRKVLADVAMADGRVLPAEAIVFAMHPGLARPSGEALPPLAEASESSELQQAALRLFGVGPRACTAAETSLAVLCCTLEAILRRYEVRVPTGVSTERLLAYAPDGSLLVPRYEVPLLLTRRDECS